MKRRAVSQLHPESQDSGIHEDVYSSDAESEASTTDRKKYKAAKNQEKLAEAPPVEQSNSFLSLLESLKDPEIGKKTEERLKKIEESSCDNITPRKILPSENKKYKELAKINCKLRLGGKNLGKGSMELINLLEKNNFMLVFRNCIKKVLFSGFVNKLSAMKIEESKCKDKHDGKTDLSLCVLQQPEMKVCRCLMCGDDSEIQSMFKEISLIVNNKVEEVKE